jgi:hypothetical protein
MAFSERLANVYPNTNTELIEKFPAFIRGKSPELQETVRQLLLLFDQATIIQHEKPGDAEKAAVRSKTPILSLLPLKDDGLVEFVTAPGEPEMWQNLKEKSYRELWTKNDDRIRKWWPLLAEQLVIKRYIPHASFLEVLRQRRLDIRRAENGELALAVAAVPDNLRSNATEIISADPGYYDFVVFSTLGELIQTDQLIFRWNNDANANGTPYIATTAISANSVWKPEAHPGGLIQVAIHELMKDNIEFVLPGSLREVRRLRENHDIVGFRSFFLPWFDALREGRFDDEKKLRHEVSISAKLFKAHHMVRTIGHWAAILALIAESPLLEVAHLGLDWFSSRARRRSKWIGLCGRERPEALTVDVMKEADNQLEVQKFEQSGSGRSG